MADYVPKTAVITGASSGIGEAMAITLSKRDLTLVLVARRLEKLRELRARILKDFPERKVHILGLDVNDKALPAEIAIATNERVDILINNAGIALGREKVESSNFLEWEQMITTNITANFRLAHLVTPWMLKHGGGDIINLCSVAAHFTYQGGAVYCATKSAVHSFTRVLREETAGKNIRVMQISPGMVDTEFSTVRFRGDKKAAESVYAGMDPMRGEDIARMMNFMLEQPRHVVIDEIVTMAMAQGSPTHVVRKTT